MHDLIVVVPSRGRPSAAKDLAGAFLSTATERTRMIVAVDADDPTGDEYDGVSTAGETRYKTQIGQGPMTMVRALNTVALHQAFLEDPPFAIGFMGDDHRPRTQGWDKLYLDALRELGTGIVYGNDLLQGERIPTQVAMTSDIIRALGYMAPPSLTHLYVDNFWLDLGKADGCIRYLPDVVVEHCHPIAGKAAWDEGYRRVNNSAMYERDEAAYLKYRAEQFDTDVATVRALRGGA